MPRRKSSAPKIPCQIGWAIYLRTSNGYVQAPERSREMQRQSIDPVIEHSNMPIIEEYIDVQSGKTLNRRNFQRMLDDAAKGKFSHIIVAYPDRFGRNTAEALTTLDHLQELGVKVRVSTIPEVEDITSRRGRMHITIMFALAEQESSQHGERIKTVQSVLNKNGFWAWKAPDGYKNARREIPFMATDERQAFGRSKGYIVQDEQQAQVWRSAWDMLLYEDLSLEEICERLHAKGYRLRSGSTFVTITDEGKRKRNRTALSRVFHNPFYAGLLKTYDENGSPVVRRGEWEPIVTLEEFEAGEQRLKERDKNRNHRPDNFYLLQGKVHLQQTNGKLKRLTCSTVNKNRARGGMVSHYCNRSRSPFFKCKDVDEQVNHWLHGIVVAPDLLPTLQEIFEQEAKKRLMAHGPDEITAMNEALARINDERERVTRKYAMGRIDEALFDRLCDEWDDQQAQILRALHSQKVDFDRHMGDLNCALNMLAIVGTLYDALDAKGQRELLRNLVERVIINGQGKIVDVVLYAPFQYIRDRLNYPDDEWMGERYGDNNEQTALSGAAGSTDVTLGGSSRIRTYNQTVMSRLL